MNIPTSETIETAETPEFDHHVATFWQGMRELLLEHDPVDDTENWALSELLLNLEGGPEKLTRDSEGSHFTVSCFCLDPTGTSALMLRHKKLGKLLNPGGHLEPNDSSCSNGAIREVFEEALPPGSPSPTLMLGGSLFDVDAHDIPAGHGMSAHRHLDLRFLARMPKGYQPWFNPEEASGAVMVPLAELAHSSEEVSMRRMARKAIEIVEARARMAASSAS